jgi:hypothetical protein
MKTLLKLTSILFISLIFLSLTFFACSEDDIEPNENKSTFETSVAIIQNGIDINKYSSKSSGDFSLKLKLKNFDPNFELSPVYKFDGIEYSDNGLFNDEIAGDGIYISVQKFNYASKRNLYNGITINKSEKFEHTEKLNAFLLSNYTNNKSNIQSKVRPKLKFKLGCKVRLVDCPDTSWYNTSWFGEPCVEFYDCEASVEVILGD